MEEKNPSQAGKCDRRGEKIGDGGGVNILPRWSSTPPVSDEVRLQWKGICALSAYFTKEVA
ncbi:hypothetical protein JHK85_047676 [Glycine max]|nr:hypothetical protein JHK85_047676 [Glycine max]